MKVIARQRGRMVAVLVAAATASLVGLAKPGPAAVGPEKPAVPSTQSVPRAAEGTEFPVRVVSLYSSGVGYFERVGRVGGGPSGELRFETGDVDDVLKSLVVQDAGGGAVESVAYPAQQPVAKALAGFEVDLSGDFSMPALLTQLRGKSVVVSVGAEQVAAKVLGVDRRVKPAGDDGSVEVRTLSLYGDGGMRTVELPDVRGIAVRDPVLQAEIDAALDALARRSDREQKPITIRFGGGGGGGARDVRVGYVTEAPIWKATYRLILPPADVAEAKARLQGWAIVTNQTDDDWRDVRLSLVSGRPLSFAQDLSQPLYVPRPVVEPEPYANLRSPRYEGGISAGSQGQGRRGTAEAARTDAAVMRQAVAAAPDRTRSLAADAANAAGAAGKARDASAVDTAAVVASSVSSAELGELFEYALSGVTVPRHESAMIPIVTEPVAVERLSVYDRSVLKAHPLYGARLKNTTGRHLPHGPITVFEAQAYAGDARIETLPPGQERLVTYGIDLDLRVNTPGVQNEQAVADAKVVDGLLHLSRRHVVTQKYVVQNTADEARRVVVVHPFRQGWDLVEPRSPLERTDQVYRFGIDVPAGETETLTVREQNVVGQTVAILPTDAGQLLAYAKTAEIDSKVRQALQRAAELKRAVEQSRDQIDRHRQEIQTIAQEQARLRQNMEVVDRDTEYHARLMKKLSEQETRIETLRSEIETLQTSLEERQARLEEYVRNLGAGTGGATDAATQRSKS